MTLCSVRFAPVQWFDSLKSTNDTLHQMLRENRQLALGTVIAARQQTSGKGRNGRSWQSTAGKDLTFSFLLRMQVSAEQSLSLPLVAGVGMATALEEISLEPQLKWPNDIFIGDRKIAGILSEQVSDKDEVIPAVIVGIGLNVNMNRRQAEQIDQPATSVALETGRDYALEEMMDIALNHLTRWLNLWQEQGFAGVRSAWLGRCAMLDNEISVTGNKGQILTGRMRGLGPLGQLLLTDQSGATQSILCGDVSLRGVL